MPVTSDATSAIPATRPVTSGSGVSRRYSRSSPRLSTMPTTARSSLFRSTATRRPGSIPGRNVRNRLDAYAIQPPICATQNQPRDESAHMTTNLLLLQLGHEDFIDDPPFAVRLEQRHVVDDVGVGIIEHDFPDGCVSGHIDEID